MPQPIFLYDLSYIAFIYNVDTLLTILSQNQVWKICNLHTQPIISADFYSFPCNSSEPVVKLRGVRTDLDSSVVDSLGYPGTQSVIIRA